MSAARSERGDDGDGIEWFLRTFGSVVLGEKLLGGGGKKLFIRSGEIRVAAAVGDFFFFSHSD